MISSKSLPFNLNQGLPTLLNLRTPTPNLQNLVYHQDFLTNYLKTSLHQIKRHYSNNNKMRMIIN
jgi:hypothetical protein